MDTNEYYAHPTAVIDEGCTIGKGTKIWHFSHVMPKCIIGEQCNIGQNVVISPEVVLGRNVKIQNNVSIYTGVTCDDDVFLGPSMVFTNVINPRSAVNRKTNTPKRMLVKEHPLAPMQRLCVVTTLEPTHLLVRALWLPKTFPHTVYG
jgi:UDP-2-acetamido-3-amino-2,3-dideoxy-glucuronate N-acetyltransferase